MKISTFNFCVALWCASWAAFGNQEQWIVVLNVVLAILNLLTGLIMHRQEN